MSIGIGELHHISLRIGLNDEERMETSDRSTSTVKMTGQGIASQIDRTKSEMNDRRDRRGGTTVEIQLMVMRIIRHTTERIMNEQSYILDRIDLKVTFLQETLKQRERERKLPVRSSSRSSALSGERDRHISTLK